MTITGAQSLDQPAIVRTAIFRINRILQADDSWKTTTSFDSTSPYGRPPAGSTSTFDLGSIVRISNSSSFQMLDRQGAVVAAPSNLNIDSMMAGRSQFDSPDRASIPPFPARTPTGRVVGATPGASASVVAAQSSAPAHDPRAWIRNLLVTPQRRAATRAMIVSALGAPVGKVGSLDRFTMRRNGELLERLVDPLTGVTTEENIAENGALRVHTQHRYLTLKNGTMVRIGTHTEIANASGGRGAVMDVTYSGIVLDTLGGVQ
jgi:hypothetical protein